MKRMRVRKPRSGRLGLTLIELVVGVSVGGLVLLLAVAFAHQEIAMLDISADTLEMTQAGRLSLDMVADDLVNAGVGVGYSEAGEFMGLEVGAFGGAGVFNSNNRLVGGHEVGAGGTIPSDDIRMRVADGETATIVQWTGSSGIVCGPASFAADDKVVVRTADGLSAKVITLSANSAVAVCPNDPVSNSPACATSCVGIAGSAETDFDNDFPAGVGADYTGGYVAGNYREVTYFIEAADPEFEAYPGSNLYIGRLRRVIGDCTIPDHTCGDVVADNVESMQMRVYEFDGTAWVDVTATGSRIDGSGRIRVDIELAIRARSPEANAIYEPAQLILFSNAAGAPYCLPGGLACGTNKDNIRRLVMRTSVELRNGGRMRIQRGDET